MFKTNLDLKKALKKKVAKDFVQKIKCLVSLLLFFWLNSTNTVFISICDESFYKVLLKTL